MKLEQLIADAEKRVGKAAAAPIEMLVLAGCSRCGRRLMDTGHITPNSLVMFGGGKVFGVLCESCRIEFMRSSEYVD